jgi:hypothetical protein
MPMMINSIAAPPRLPLRFSPCTIHLFRLLHEIAAPRTLKTVAANSLSVHARLHKYLRSLLWAALLDFVRRHY